MVASFEPNGRVRSYEYFLCRGIQWNQRIDALVFIPLFYLMLVLYELFYLQEYASNGMKVNAPVEEHRVYLRADQQMNLNTVHVPIKPSSIVNGRKTIIMISNYRDSVRCSETLRSIFTSAVTPDNIKISIYDQIYAAENERPCAQQFCELVGEMFCRRSQIVSSQIDAINATGPTAARYETEKVITNEDFCMAIDSHMVFVPDWDEKIMAQWDSVENPNAIISTYPKDIINIASRKVDDTMHIMCLARIEVNIADAMVMYDPASVIKKKDTPKAILVSQLAGGFNFGGCKQAKEVRNDPHTPFLFHGEEYSRAARLWTNGYDFYAPSEDIVFHWYEKRKVVWERDWNERYLIQQQSRRRVRYILKLPVTKEDFDRTDLKNYTLGTKRTFEQWKNFSGIDPQAKFIPQDIAQFNNCRKLEYVQY